MRWYRDRYEIIDHASTLAPDHGLVLEFGVAMGGTLRLLAKLFCPRQVTGFDSFKGLPEAWGSYQPGHFACDPPIVPSNCTLEIGLFADTLPAFLARNSDNVAFVHIDCDLYSSTKTIFDALGPRIVDGTVIVLDEYYIVEDHERRAFDEWIARDGRSCRLDSRAYEQACMIMMGEPHADDTGQGRVAI